MRTPVVTHHLEMTHPSQLVPARAPDVPFTLARVEHPNPQLCRFLYTAVGGDWYWVERLEWTCDRWQRHLEREDVETWVAWAAGAPVGYFELNGPAGGNVEIAYLGLLPQFTGRGFGGALLTAAVERAWEVGASRVWLHTCTLDHPSALPGYLARGFRIFNVVHSKREFPAQPPGPWPGAFP